MLRNSTSSQNNFLWAAVISSLLVLSLSGKIASAASLQDLRASGALGESYNGYVVARDGDAEAEAEAINEKRKAVYAEKASAKGVAIEQVGKIYAREISDKVPAGTWIQNEEGQWLQK